MKNFTNDFKKEFLLINKPVTFTETGTGKKVQLNLPTIRDLYEHDELMVLIGILEKTVEDLGKMFSGLEVKSHYGFLGVIVSLGNRMKELSEMKESILKAFSLILPESEFTSGLIKFKNGVFMTNEMFVSMQEILLESAGREKPIIIKEEDDEFTRREKEAEARIKKIRESARDKKQQKEGRDSFGDMIATLLYEYPQYKIEDFFNMNMYTINYLFIYVGKIANYEVMKIAAGNGLAKDFKYFTE